MPLVVRGIDIDRNPCLKIVIGKMVVYARVTGVTENPMVIILEDIYGNSGVVDIRRATMIMTMPCEEWETKARNARKAKGEG